MSLKPIITKIRRKFDAFTAKTNPDGQYILYDNRLELLSNKILIYVIHLTAGDPPSVIFDNIALYEELGFDIIVIITASDRSIESVIDLTKKIFKNMRVIVRKNYGKDFGGFSDALSVVPREFNGKLVFQNDSLIGPLYPSDFLRKFINMESEFAGVTESFFPKYHLQSSFLMFSGQALQKLRHFFKKNYKVYNFYPNIIHLGEIELTQFMLRNNISIEPFFKHFELLKIASYNQNLRLGFPLSKVNPQHFFAETMFTELEYPFIKRQLLTANQTNHPFLWNNILGKLDACQMNKLRESISSRL